jgi:hypothetical protein
MKKITLSELAYAMMMAVACAASYLVTSRVIGPFIDRGDSWEECGPRSRLPLCSEKRASGA